MAGVPCTTCKFGTILRKGQECTRPGTCLGVSTRDVTVVCRERELLLCCAGSSKKRGHWGPGPTLRLYFSLSLHIYIYI